MSCVRRPTIGVSGGSLHPAGGAEKAGRFVGRLLAKSGCNLLTGGGFGVVEHACRAFVDVDASRRGASIAILPCHEFDLSASPARVRARAFNPSVEIPIQTHLAGTTFPLPPDDDLRSRNHILALAPDALIALPGGDGTASEIRIALMLEKPVVAFGWTDTSALEPFGDRLERIDDERRLEAWLASRLSLLD